MTSVAVFVFCRRRSSQQEEYGDEKAVVDAYAASRDTRRRLRGLRAWMEDS